MNQTEKLASAAFLIKKAEMDVGTTALTGGAIGSLLLALLGKGRRMNTGYRFKNKPTPKFPKIRYTGSGLDDRDLQSAGAILGGVGGAGAGGVMAALSNALTGKSD